MQITTVITKAEPRIVNRRDGSGSFTLFELFDHEGTAWVVRDDVYNQALGLIGQTVDMIVRVEQKGSYTNRYCDIVQPSINGQVPASNAVQQAYQAAQAAARVQPTMPQQPAQMGWQQQGGAMVPSTTGEFTQSPPQLQDVSVWPTKTDLAIHRQTAAKVAAQISTSASEFWSNCVDLARYFGSGQVPGSAGQASPTGNPDQQFAAAGTGYSNSPPPYTDDDAPF